MFCKLFKKKEKKVSENLIEVFAPISGKFVKLEEVPDKTFADKLLGEGVAINPTKAGEIVAPVDGKLIQLFVTGHAFTIETECGVNVLVHFGMNTVDLNGEGFTKLVKEGAQVKKGQPIIKYDYEFLKENATSVITPIVVLDSEEYENISVVENDEVVAGETVVLKIRK